MGLSQIYKLLHSKGNHKKKKTTYRMGENNCKRCNQLQMVKLNLQNIQTTITAQQEKKKQQQPQQQNPPN